MQLDTEATVIKAGRNSIPSARTNGNNVSFTQLSESLTDDVVSSDRERNLWKLTAILFDPVERSCAEYMQGYLTRWFITVITNISDVEGWNRWLCQNMSVDSLNQVGLIGNFVVNETCQAAKSQK